MVVIVRHPLYYSGQNPDLMRNAAISKVNRYSLTKTVGAHHRTEVRQKKSIIYYLLINMQNCASGIIKIGRMPVEEVQNIHQIRYFCYIIRSSLSHFAYLAQSTLGIVHNLSIREPETHLDSLTDIVNQAGYNQSSRHQSM